MFGSFWYLNSIEVDCVGVLLVAYLQEVCAANTDHALSACTQDTFKYFKHLDVLLRCMFGSLISCCVSVCGMQVTDDMKTGKGGGLEAEGECIEVIEVPRAKAKQFMMDESKPKSTSLLFGFSVFLGSPELLE